MKKWPGTDVFQSDNTPWNVLSSQTLRKELTDRGSLPTALSATLLGYLGKEENSTFLSAIDDLATSTYNTKALAHFECDLGNVYAMYGATVYFAGASNKFDYIDNQNWHKVRRTKGLYKDNHVSGDNQNVQLNSMPTLIDDSFSVASVSNITESNICVGVQVGDENNGEVYENVVDGLLIVTNKTGVNNWIPYKSENNRQWSSITKSSHNSDGWTSGEREYSNFRASGASVVGRMILFAQPEKANYFMAVRPTVFSAGFNLYECYALNLQGELRTSKDLEYWEGHSRNTSFSDFLLFKFDQTDNEMRAIEYYIDPFDPASAKDARIDIDHFEAYADTRATDFGSDGTTRIVQIETGDLGGEGDAQRLLVYNGDPRSRTVNKAYAFVSLDPRTVTAASLTSGVTSFNLADSTRRVTYCRYILNSDTTDIGDSTDTSVVFGGTMAAWTEVTGTPSGNQYKINYSTGAVETGNAVPAGATYTFSYANPGAAALEISANGVTSWVGPGVINKITLESTDILPGETGYLYAKSQLTNFSQTIEDVIRAGLLMVEFEFKGSQSISTTAS